MLTLLIVSSILAVVISCQDHRIPSPSGLTAVQGPPFATGLKSPIGLTDDPKGNLWVTEAGSGTVNNGQVTVITPAGAMYPAITGFVSAISPENSPEGLNHLLYKDGKLYILHGVEEKLYIVDISGFVPGVSAPIPASSLTGIDIGTFVRTARPNAPDAPDSNPYNLTFGPNGDLFITDAGGNAIIRRDKTTGALSVFAIFPDTPNPGFPASPGPPTLDPVPTGIVFDGTNFFVTTLIGFPFPAGQAKIYQVAGTGTAPITPSVYKSGFSGLTDLTFTPGGKLLVTEFGFSTTGRVASGEDATKTLFTPAITPVDILLSTAIPDTYYVLYYGPGIIVKMTAN
ncbi:ScyD/ScyE family protein [Spirosoma gilvum]